MSRPHKERCVEQLPPVTCYKPAGIPMRSIDEVVLTIEEMEAVRLADVEQLNQAAAAERMNVSRPTFHRMINLAHQKIATALWQGHALRVDGGTFRITHVGQKGLRQFRCQSCGHTWTLPHGTGQRCQDLSCPDCQSSQIRRED